MGNKKPTNAPAKKTSTHSKKNSIKKKGARPSKRNHLNATTQSSKQPAGRPHTQTKGKQTNSTISSACPVSHQCGACQLIDVDYQKQLEDKQQAIIDLFDDLADENCALHPILGMKNPYHYRNKVVSPFAPGKRLKTPDGKQAQKATRSRHGSPKVQREILCGMYAKGTHKIIDTTDCLLENEKAQRIIKAIRHLMPKFGIEPYNEDAGTGFLRHAVVRIGHSSGEILVTLVTNGKEFPASKSFCRELKKRVPEITTIVQNVNTRLTNVILGDEGEQVLYGPGFILDDLCGLRFRISAHSFYQVNALQTEVLYRKAIEFAQLTGNETVMDAYCGTGTIGLVAATGADCTTKEEPARVDEGVAPNDPKDAASKSQTKFNEDPVTEDVRSQGGKASRVIGVDKVSNAIRDARNNARHNHIDNAEFFAEDAGDFMRKMAEAEQALDVLFMDPPRAGSTPEFLSSACHLAPRCIVYISCNPTTQARDVAFLTKRGYVLTDIQPVDMFPHTEHIENICRLELKAATE